MSKNRTEFDDILMKYPNAWAMPVATSFGKEYIIYSIQHESGFLFWMYCFLIDMNISLAPDASKSLTAFRRVNKKIDKDFLVAYQEVLDIYHNLTEDYRFFDDNYNLYGILNNWEIAFDGNILNNGDILSIIENAFITKGMKRRIIDNCEWVYLLGNEQEGKYKIGMTTRTPTKRVNEFSPKLPFETKVLAQCPTPNAYGLESKLHKMFSDKRTNGEWFELSRGEMLYIRSMSL